jgi:hypothetical protein
MTQRQTLIAALSIMSAPRQLTAASRRGGRRHDLWYGPGHEVEAACARIQWYSEKDAAVRWEEKPDLGAGNVMKSKLMAA